MRTLNANETLTESRWDTCLPFHMHLLDPLIVDLLHFMDHYFREGQRRIDGTIFFRFIRQIFWKNVSATMPWGAGIISRKHGWNDSLFSTCLTSSSRWFFRTIISITLLVCGTRVCSVCTHHQQPIFHQIISQFANFGVIINHTINHPRRFI